MYQADIERKRSEEAFVGTKEQFLQTLGMRMTIRPASTMDLRRAEELTLRTHQLNTTGRPYSYEQLDALSVAPSHLLLVAELEDRYGTSGTIGLALVERRPDVWLVNLLITSCRVISRGIGSIMISYILQSAQRSGLKVRAEFVANEHNRMMYAAYKFHGFYEVLQQGDYTLLQHDLAKIRPFPNYVTVQCASEVT
jgi:FkbH-like protein